MKKMIVIIIILACILVGMVVYKNVAIKTGNKVNVQEIQAIETYITKIYMWKEVTRRSITNF